MPETKKERNRRKIKERDKVSKLLRKEEKKAEKEVKKEAKQEEKYELAEDEDFDDFEEVLDSSTIEKLFKE